MLVINICCFATSQLPTTQLNSLWFVQRNGPSFINIPNLKRIAQFVQKLLRVPKIWNLGHVIRPRPLKVRFMIRT